MLASIGITATTISAANGVITGTALMPSKDQGQRRVIPICSRVTMTDIVKSKGVIALLDIHCLRLRALDDGVSGIEYV